MKTLAEILGGAVGLIITIAAIYYWRRGLDRFGGWATRRPRGKIYSATNADARLVHDAEAAISRDQYVISHAHRDGRAVMITRTSPPLVVSLKRERPMYDGGHPAIIIQQVYDTSPNPPEELAGRIASGWEG